MWQGFAMREYGKVYTAFWTSEDVAAMSEDERTLALYLLTCPHGNMLGCFRLPEAYASDDLKWKSERVSKGFSGLIAKGYIYRCERSSWVVILRYLKWNQFENPNVGKAAGKLFESLPAPAVAKAALAAGLREFATVFPIAILDKFEAENEPFRNPSGLSPETGTGTGTGTGEGTGEKNDTSAKLAAAAPNPPDPVDTEESPEPRQKRRGTEDDERCARWLFGRILANSPEHRPPNFATWANDVRLMRERDSRTHHDICELFAWAQADGFWHANILSPSKLREKWDQLALQRKRSAPAAAEGVPQLGKAGQATARAAEEWLKEQGHG